MFKFFNVIIDILNGNEIAYMLSGSVAMSLYVVPRATRNFDFIIHLTTENLEAFVAHFQEGYYCDKDQIQDALRNPDHGMFNIIDHASGYKADFVVLKNVPFRQEEFRLTFQNG